MKNKKVNLGKAAGGFGIGSFAKKAGKTIFGAAKKFGSSKIGKDILKAGGKEILKLGKSKKSQSQSKPKTPSFEEYSFIDDDFD